MTSRAARPHVLVVLVTCPSRAAARKIADAVIRARAAACVNLVPGLESVFRWQGAIDRAKEVLLLIKTTTHAYPKLAAVIARTHPYEVPEILALPVQAGSPAYLQWVRESVRPAEN